MTTEELGIEHTLVETHTYSSCVKPEKYYCDGFETVTTTLININFITLLMAISPFFIIYLAVKLLRRPKGK